MSATDRLDAIEARAEKGATEVIRLCSINERVRMSIPADTERDTDLILIDVCDSVTPLVAALRAVLDLVKYVGNESTGPEFVACYEVRDAITAALGVSS